MHGELERIEFGRDDDMRCIMVGRGIPFRFGVVTGLTYVGGAVNITIKPDHFTDRAVAGSRRPWWRRMFNGWMRGGTWR